LALQRIRSVAPFSGFSVPPPLQLPGNSAKGPSAAEIGIGDKAIAATMAQARMAVRASTRKIRVRKGRFPFKVGVDLPKWGHRPSNKQGVSVPVKNACLQHAKSSGKSAVNMAPQ
jgi:hypothetical protein